MIERTRDRVVLVHGTRDTPSSFDGARPWLVDLDLTTYTRRGWERGSVAEPAPLETHVDDLLRVIDGKPSVVVGHSWGCHVTIAAAIRRPDLIRSIGVWEPSRAGTPTWPTELRDHLVAAIERARRRLAASPDRHRERVFIAEASTSLVSQADLDDLQVPCVVGVGGASNPLFVKALEAIAMSIGAELFEIPGARHMAHREEPEAFAAFVRRAVALATG